MQVVASAQLSPLQRDTIVQLRNQFLTSVGALGRRRRELAVLLQVHSQLVAVDFLHRAPLFPFRHYVFGCSCFPLTFAVMLISAMHATSACSASPVLHWWGCSLL